MEALKHDVVDLDRRRVMEANNYESSRHQWDTTKIELSDKVHHYKQSLENVKETLQGDLSTTVESN